MPVVATPDGTNRIVVSETALPAFLARGYGADAGFCQAAQAAAGEKRQAWLADPASGAERFAMLREERDRRIARTDYLLQGDYPLDPALAQKVIAFRQALRDLPAQPGAPWDGGGPGTPWPLNPLL